MKFVIALLLAQTSAIRLRQTQDVAISYAPVSQQFVQIQEGAAQAKDAKTPELSPKQAAAAKAAQPIEEKIQNGAEQDAKDKKVKADTIKKENIGDMKSNAAIWAGHGAPPPLTAGDISTMAAPRPGFDPSLNPGAPNGVESVHTEATAAKEKELKKDGAKKSLAQEEPAAADAKKADDPKPDEEQKPVAEKQAEKAAKEAGEKPVDPDAKSNVPELSPKQAAANEAKKPFVEKKSDKDSTPAEVAEKKEKAAEDMEKKNAGDMGSNAATWAGDGAPPGLTSGDTATMAAPRPGFDPSLNPGSPNGVESSHTAAVAAENAKPAPKQAAAKEAKAEKSLIQKNAPDAKDAKLADGPAELSPKQEAAAKAAAPVQKKPQSIDKDANIAANEAEANAAKISKSNEADMGSTAATWAGSGAPPPITAGDTATMAAPRPGFDPSLNPGSPGAVESVNTTNVAAEHAKPTKPEELSKKKTLVQKNAPEAKVAKDAKKEAPEPAAEPTPKQEAAAKAAKPIVKKAQGSAKDANIAANEAEANADKIAAKNEVDMKSSAAIWSGSGAPPAVTAGDIATMAAPRPGFDPSLNPGTPGAVESVNTTNVAAEHAKPTKKE